MSRYQDLSASELARELQQLRDHYCVFQQRGLTLNMARGKPSPEQLDLSMPLLDFPAHAAGSSSDTCAILSRELRAGQPDDLRNYGELLGITEAQELMGAIMEVPAKNVVVSGNSSLALMFDLVSAAMSHGVLGSTPWQRLDSRPKFLCPVPGYDRHFAICAYFDIEMISVPLNSDGPDMDKVESLVGSNALVKGIWCVPKFSNPSGVVYTDAIVDRLAALRPAAQDFRMYWDNSYAVHDFASPIRLANIRNRCEHHHNPDLWYQFASTSKITFASGGIAALSSSQNNLQDIAKRLGLRSIGPDKLNQKRHSLFLPDIEAVYAHMAKHAALVRPKFAVVLRELDNSLGGLDIGTWTRPDGGYFISFTGLLGTAGRTVELAAAAGVTLTPAGVTYPYGQDPQDANIRIAPTYPTLPALEEASKIFTLCVRIAALEQLLRQDRTKEAETGQRRTKEDKTGHAG
ncbi:MAG: aminotransferase [Coriobacteriales bacterium]|jgi:DNA-binding transcriptional MocR family regulator|nr:aminotransferase [Coriobacteriales bacterium]